MTAPVVELLSFRPNLPVRDIERSLAFYCGIVGFEAVHVDADGSFALLRSGDAEVALVRDGAPAPQGAYLYVRGVEAHLSRCQGARLAVVYPLTDEPWGLRNFVVEDLDGHRIAIGERIG